MSANLQGQDPPVVNLSWQTSLEVNTSGFYLYRQGGVETKAFAPLTGLFISLGAQGGTYQYTDTNVLPGVEYRYLLVERKQNDLLLEYPELIQVVSIGAGGNPDASRVWLPLITR